MKTVLIVAEKPSIAASFASVLCTRGEPFVSGGKLPLHEFEGTFRGESVHYRVTSVAGHVFSCDFPAHYQSWDAVDPVELFKAPVQKTCESKGVLAHLQDCARGIDVIILATDADREGENICFEILDVISLSTPASSRRDHVEVWRAKFSAVSKGDIDRALRPENLVKPNENESLAVDARQELDLKVGVAFSRFQTRFFQGRYGNLDSSLISFGPCQTPTLGFCVERHDEIMTFTPEPFWTLDIDITSKPGFTLKPEWDRGRIFDQEIARLFETLVSEAGPFIVTSVSESETKRARPTALNTTAMLKAASRHLGMGPAQTMHAAERLYLSGLISYPRTESTQYPDSFDFASTVAAQRSHPWWGTYASELLRSGMERPKKGTDVGDHPPIVPVRCPLHGELTGGGDGERLYELITRHFLASISPDAVYMTTKVSLQCGPEGFSLHGRRMLVPGFTAVLTHASSGSGSGTGSGSGDDSEEGDEVGSRRDVLLPTFAVGEKLFPSSIGLQGGKTSPPGYLTESELIDLMERHGIGTDASMATHIQNIATRNYVTVEPGTRCLRPTQLGVVLVHGYHRIDSELVLPKVRAAIEQQCGLIAEGKARKEDVLRHALAIFEAKFRYFCSAIAAMDALFQSVFDPVAQSGKPLSRCGKCRRYMRYISLKPQRMYCPQCEETYALPQNGTVKLYKEIKCPLDGFELLIFSLGNSASALGTTYVLCPYCYNHPPSLGDNDGAPHQGIKPGMGCNRCPHPTCPQGLAHNGVCPCPGTLSASTTASSSAAAGAGAGSERGGRRGGRGARGGGGASATAATTRSAEAAAAAGFSLADANPNAPAQATLVSTAGAYGRGVSLALTSTAFRHDHGDEDDGEEDEHVGGLGGGCPGVIVLDRDSKPNWKMACNACPLIVRFHGNLHDVLTLPGEVCDTCGSTLLQITYHKDKASASSSASAATPATGGAGAGSAGAAGTGAGGSGGLVHRGCVLCDETINSLTELKESRTRHIALARRGRGGRGGRGRGRGRGRRPATKHELLMSFDGF